MGKRYEDDTRMQLVLSARMPGTAFISQNDFLKLCVLKNKRIWRGLEREKVPSVERKKIISTYGG